MADKTSFILHLDSLAILDELTNEQKGILFDAIYKFHLGKEPELDFAMRLAFASFKNQFIRDNEKYTEFSRRQSANGSLGGRPKKNPNKPKKPRPFLENPKNPTKAKKAYKDSVSDSDSDKDSKKESDNDLLPPPDFFSEPALIQNAVPDIKIPDGVSEVFDSYNFITGQKREINKSRISLVKKLLSAGYSLADFESVVKSKFLEWKDDEKMKTYITPETIFAEKNFVKYLENVRMVASPTQQKPFNRPMVY